MTSSPPKKPERQDESDPNTPFAPSPRRLSESQNLWDPRA
jgi:hypothetical protein